MAKTGAGPHDWERGVVPKLTGENMVKPWGWETAAWGDDISPE